VDPIPNPPLLGKCGIVWNRTRDLWICRASIIKKKWGGGDSGSQIQTDLEEEDAA
jgi:hypothetical protein